MPLNLTNADASKQDFCFKISSPFPVTLLRAFSSDDANFFFNSNRLEKQTPDNGEYRVELLPGESIQFFLKVAVPAEAKPGKYTISVGNYNFRKDFNLIVGKLKFPAELSTEYGTWDYLNTLGCHAQSVDKSNIDAALQLIREYQMNVSWGHEAALPKAFP